MIKFLYLSIDVVALCLLEIKTHHFNRYKSIKCSRSNQFIKVNECKVAVQSRTLKLNLTILKPIEKPIYVSLYIRQEFFRVDCNHCLRFSWRKAMEQSFGKFTRLYFWIKFNLTIFIVFLFCIAGFLKYGYLSTKYLLQTHQVY